MSSENCQKVNKMDIVESKHLPCVQQHCQDFKIVTDNYDLSPQEFVQEVEHAPPLIVDLICQYRQPCKQESIELTLEDTLGMHQDSFLAKDVVLAFQGGVNKITLLHWVYKWILFTSPRHTPKIQVSRLFSIKDKHLDALTTFRNYLRQGRHNLFMSFRIQVCLDNVRNALENLTELKRQFVVTPVTRNTPGYGQKFCSYDYTATGEQEFKKLQEQIFEDHIAYYKKKVGEKLATLNEAVCLYLYCHIFCVF